MPGVKSWATELRHGWHLDLVGPLGNVIGQVVEYSKDLVGPSLEKTTLVNNFVSFSELIPGLIEDNSDLRVGSCGLAAWGVQ